MKKFNPGYRETESRVFCAKPSELGEPYSFSKFLQLACLISVIWFLAYEHGKAELTIGAAISLTAPITEISAAYEKKNGEEIRVTFSGSNTIARQIEAGAPIDIFISADEETMSYLIQKKLIEKSSQKLIAGNELVAITPRASKLTLSSPAGLLSLKRIAIASPQSVPAGIYAKKWLIAEGLWPRIQPEIVPLQNVRSALIAAETSNAQAAIVYRTEALSSQKVKIAFAIPTLKTGPIRYPAALVSSTKQKIASRKFLEFLLSEVSQEILTKHGFTKP